MRIWIGPSDWWIGADLGWCIQLSYLRDRKISLTVVRLPPPSDDVILAPSSTNLKVTANAAAQTPPGEPDGPRELVIIESQ